MIQSDKFDSSTMNIKNIANLTFIFILRRLIEILGLVVLILGFLLFISLLTYSPQDPNFIFPENTQIKNLLGYQGSYVSDLFFQSIGLIAFLIPITLIFTGYNIFKKKDVFLFIENLFYVLICSISGSLFFNYFYSETFNLYINGNGGFVGNYLNQKFINNFISSYEIFSFYFLILITLILFLKSINFNLKNFLSSLKKIILILFKKEEKSYTDKSEIINEYIPQEEIKNLIQEDLPFIKTESNQSNNKNKFKLPDIELLKIPSKKEKVKSQNNENNDPKFLEKIFY